MFLLLVLAIQIPSVQNYAKEKMVTYLEGKIKTKVVIDKFTIGFPEKIILEGVYFEDQKKDTLLSGDKIAVDMSLFQLMNNKVEIKTIDLKGITANVNRGSNAVFNFDYILNAFTSPKKPKDDSTPMEFSVEEITLDKVKVKYADAISKNDLIVNLNYFQTKIKTFDLEQMNFEIPKVKVKGLKLKLIQGILQPKTIAKNNNSDTPLKLKLGEIDLAKIDLDYHSEENKITTAFYVKKVLAKINKIDLDNQILLIETIDLTGTEGSLKLGKTIKINKTISPNEANNWEVKVNKTEFKRVNFRFDDDNAVALNKGLDYNHLDIKSLNLAINALNYNAENSSAEINSLSVRERSGLHIESFTAELFYGKKNAFLKKLYLKTPQTLLKDEILIGYPSIESIAKNLGELSINATLKKSKLGFKDILLFVPTLDKNDPFKSNPNAILQIDGKVFGKLKNIEIPNLEVSGIGTTRIAANGKITGLPDIEKAYFDLTIKDLQSNSKDIGQLVSKGSIPNSIQLPSKFSVKGNFKGTISKFNTNMNLVSSFGNATIKATLDRSIKNKEKYNAQTDLTSFDLGKFIKNDSLGKVTLKANIKGSGFNPKTATASFNGAILKAYYNKYTYQNLSLKGTIHNGNFNATAVAKDPNLTFDLVSNGSFKDKNPTGKIQLNVDIADLEKLNLHAGPLKIRGVIDADIQSANLDYLNGSLQAHSLSITNAKEQFEIDSINLTATSTAEKNSLMLTSSFLDAEINGKYTLSKLAAALSNSIAHYYDNNPKSKKPAVDKQEFTFKMGIKNNPIVLKLIPQLKSLEPIFVEGKYNSQNDSILFNAIIPKLIYADNTISNAVLKVDTKDQALVYSLIVDDIQNPKFQLPYTAISGKVKNNLVDYSLQLKDSEDKERYLISGTLKAENGNNEINLDHSKLMLNYESWKISQNNLILFGKKGIYANDFELSKNGNSIRIQSQSEKPNAPLSIDFNDFDIKTITSMVEKNDLQMSGKINGNALVKDLTKTPVFTSDLSIENFTFKKDTIGHINIKVDNEIANQLDAHIAITGQGNQVNLDGNYQTTNGSFDMNLAIEKLNMKSIQGFTFNTITESTGFLTGNFSITGNTKQPRIIGELQFNDIGFKATQLNSKFKSANDKIVFTSEAILFDNFTIKDEKDNDLTINGKINSQNFNNFGFDLAIDADNFKAINSEAKDNALYYGELFLDNHLKIKGDLDNPIVEGNIKINKDTKFTIVLPQSDPSIADREGIVEFIDQDHPQIIETVATDQINSISEVKGINASVNIVVDKEAELSIIIDKVNGDYLKLKGEAQLNGGMDPSGKTTLTGKYEFSEGSYEMTFSSIKRKFDIKKGSYILWTGEPTTANINITAVYKAKIAPIDLVNDQLKTVTAEVRNSYKQRIPFETELKMKGELMKPDITFDIVLPDDNTDVSSEIINTTKAKLAQLREQPDELNKQVFALLLLSHFVGENPFSSESGGTSFSSIARESASKILSQQLNNLAGDLINGVELNFDLQSSEDYTTGQRENKTNLNIGISKKLLNDRLKVTVGSSFGIEGAEETNQNASNIAGDVTLDYQLSKDGRYKVRAYRVNKYQVALQGEVVETGIAFIITLDYNKFKELFQKSEAKKAKEKTRKDTKKKSDE
jgi:hypothetical protein